MTRVGLRILGECIIEIGASRLEPSASHAFALALYLSIERGKLVPRTLLTSLLFPDIAASVAAHNLRQLVYRLRQKGAPLQCTSAAIALPQDCVSGAPECALARTYSEALSEPTSYVLLPGYAPPTRDLSLWLESYRDNLIHKFQARLTTDLRRARQGADWDAVDHFARGLLGIDPLNETATLGLAESMARVGSKKRAVQLLRAYAQDVGVAHEQLALPSRFLTRRIAEEVPSVPIASTAITGRADELRQLTSTWAHARRGNCTITCISGEKSIGKSRVLNELAALVRLDASGTVLAFRPFQGNRGRPMSFLSEMCRELLRLPGAAGCSPDRLSYLHRLTGAPDQLTASESLGSDGATCDALTRNALSDLLDSVSAERPLLVCIDDADCLDSTSLAQLSALPDVAPSLPAYFVLASTVLSPVPNRCRSLHLAPLGPEDARAVAQCLRASGGYTVGDPSLDWCISVASGNPGHLELLMEHVAALRDTPTVPPSLIALVDEQLHSLAPAARHVLQACAIIAEECRPDIVSALTGLTGYELLSILDTLVFRGLVSDSTQGIACRSGLVAERVAITTSQAVKCLLNRRAAEYLELCVETEVASQPLFWRIADHWQAAGDRSRSLRWRRVCWQHLLSLGQPLAAADSVRTQLATSTDPRERAYLLEFLAETLRHAGDTRAQLKVLEDRETLSDLVGDDAAAKTSLAADVVEARYLIFDDTTQLLPDLRALLRAPSLDDERRLRIARVLVVTADNMLSEPLAREAIEAVPDNLQTNNTIALGLQTRTIYHAIFGDRRTAIELADLLLAIGETQELSHSLITSYLTATLAIRVVDSRELDISLLPALYDRCIAAGMLGAAIRIAGRLGSMQHEDGNLVEARNWCNRTTELVSRTSAQRVSTDYLTLRIDLALADGQLALARQLIAEAPAHFPMYGSPKWRNAYIVYRTRVEQYESCKPIAAERLKELVHWHESAKRFGRHDDHMEVLWSALTHAGQREQASATLREYVMHSRRESRPCIHTLRTRTATDPFWSELRGQSTRDRS